jgi:hypothetical protein
MVARIGQTGTRNSEIDNTEVSLPTRYLSATIVLPVSV